MISVFTFFFPCISSSSLYSLFRFNFLSSYLPNGESHALLLEEDVEGFLVLEVDLEVVVFPEPVELLFLIFHHLLLEFGDWLDQEEGPCLLLLFLYSNEVAD